jgi:hypothetical protein
MQVLFHAHARHTLMRRGLDLGLQSDVRGLSSASSTVGKALELSLSTLICQVKCR